MSIQGAEADLNNLEARANELEAELASVRSEIERIRIFLELFNRYGEAGAGRNSVPDESAASNEVDKRNTNSTNAAPLMDETLIQAFRGKSIPDAAIALIRSVGRPLSEEEIVDGLRRGGVTLVSNAPAVNLRFALLRKRKETHAVKLTEEKLWDLDHGADQADEDPKQSGFVQNRDQNDHAERSRQGLLASRQRGVKGGRKSKITPEIQGIAGFLMTEGVQESEIARQIGINIQTFHRWRAHGLVNRFENAAEARSRLREHGWTDEDIDKKLVARSE